MITRFFKFPSMELAFDLAQQNGLTFDDTLIRFSHEYAIDVVGIIYAETGNSLQDENGNDYPETAPIDGWHINVRVLDEKPIPDDFLQYEIFPQTPTRDFA